MNKTNSKKGFIGDAIVLLVYIFIFALILIAISYAANLMKSTGNGDLDSNMTNAYNGLKGFNSIAPFLIVASGMALIGSSMFIKTNPAFFGVFFLVQVVLAFASIQMANAWDGAMTNNTLSTQAAEFDLWGVMMRYFPFISIVLSIIFAIAIFAKGE